MSTELLPVMRFDSDLFPQRERVARWHHTVSSMCKVDMIDPAQEFSVRTTAWRLGQMVVSAGDYQGARSFDRCANLIRRDHVDHLMITLRVSGRCVSQSGGQQIDIDPGNILIEDLARPCRDVNHGGRRVVAFIPRDSFEKFSKVGNGLHGLVVQGEPAAMLGSHLLSLVRLLPTARQEQAQQLADATTLLVAACATPSESLLDQAAPIVDSGLLRRICQHIENNLTNPSLSTQGICGEFHISRATLYRLMSGLGGVKAFIRDQRLTKIRSVLSSPSATPRYFARLADEYQFGSAADFSRAFKAKFGHAPREARSGSVYAPYSVQVSKTDEPIFTDWLGSTLH